MAEYFWENVLKEIPKFFDDGEEQNLNKFFLYIDGKKIAEKVSSHSRAQDACAAAETAVDKIGQRQNAGKRVSREQWKNAEDSLLLMLISSLEFRKTLVEVGRNKYKLNVKLCEGA